MGSALGFSEEELYNIQRKVNPHFSGAIDLTLLVDYMSESYTTEMFEQWIRWYPGDSRGSTNFATYTQLKTALMEAGLGDIVRDLPSYVDLKSQTSKALQNKSVSSLTSHRL